MNPEEEDVPDAFKCSLTGELMKEPVVTIYGDYFERSVLMHHLDRHCTCPIRNKPLARHNVWLEPSLQEAIKEHRQMMEGGTPAVTVTLRRSNSKEDGSGSRRRRKKRSSSLKRGEAAIQQDEKEIKYYNTQLLQRREPSSSLQVTPTRSSLSSTTFASKLLKAASRSPSTEPRAGELNRSRGVQWLWRGPDAWNLYRKEDNAALEECNSSPNNTDHSILVEQGRAFVNVVERVHVSLSNGQRFRVIRGTWFLSSEGGQILPLSEPVAEALEECASSCRIHERIATEMGTMVIMESENTFVEYMVDGDVLSPTKRRVERGFCFQSIT